MGFLNSILSKRPIEFAETIAEKIARQFPSASEPKLDKKGTRRRLEGVIELIIDDLDRYQEKEKLGWIAKARLGNAFRWKLADRGYSKQFVEALTEGIIKHIASK